MQDTVVLLGSLIISAAIGGVIGWSTTQSQYFATNEKTYNIILI
jgi:hypothetical protein